MTDAQHAIAAEEVWAAYPGRTRRGRRSNVDRWALRGVDLRVTPGEMVALVGHNGSGKTTMLHVVAGVLTPQRGTMTVAGKVTSLVDLAAGMHRDLTGRENAMIAGVLSGLTRAEVRERMDEIRSFAGLEEDVLDSPMHTYSAGMGLRLGFSIAVSARPDVLLVDEVLAVGDAQFQEQCLRKVRSLIDDGCSALVVSHDLDLVREHADRAVLLRRGSVVTEGKADEVVDAYLEQAHAAGEQLPSARTVQRKATRGWRRRG